MRTEELAAKVKAVNEANRYANELYPALARVFMPLVGERIDKADGGLLARYQKLLPELPCKPALHVYRLTSNYSLAWTVKTCQMIGETHTCVYADVTVYIGNMSDGVLTGMCDPCERRTDYTVEEVQEGRRRAEAAKAAYEKARDALHPFGER